MSPTSCQTAPPRARRDKDYSECREGVSTNYDFKFLPATSDVAVPRKFRVGVALEARRFEDVPAALDAQGHDLPVQPVDVPAHRSQVAARFSQAWLP